MKSRRLWVHCRGLARAEFRCYPRRSDSCRTKRNLLSGKQRTISPIFRRPNFTKFEHNTSIGKAMTTFGTEFKKNYHKTSLFQKNAKIYNKISTSCDFRLPCLRNDYRSPESRYQMIPLVSTFTDGIKSKSFFWPVRSIQETTNFRRCPVLGKPSTPLCRLADNVEEKQAWIGNCK